MSAHQLPASSSNRDYRKILGINFFVGQAHEAVRLGLKGGLMVAPAAPALVNLPRDSHYRQAVSSADLAITDSSFMVLLWNLTRKDNINRVSGLEYLVLLLREFKRRGREKLFFVMPTKEAAEKNTRWLHGQGIGPGHYETYVAPKYSSQDMADPQLLGLLEKKRPGQVIIGLGGGTQEKLGLFLRRRLSYTPGIHCIGAAIGFLTGDQVRIPLWADQLYLGWFFRCLDKPGSFIPRYWTARKLARLLAENGDRIPE